MEIDDNIYQPNSGAFEKDEIRNGPPLSYVAEKLRNALESAHEVVWAIKRASPTILSEPPKAFGGLKELVLTPAYLSFKYSLTSFLALNNMLGMIADPEKADALLDYSHADFAAWLDVVEREGSILG